MARTASSATQLRKIIEIANKLLLDMSKEKPAKDTAKASAKKSSKKRVRRSGKELADFRKMLKAERAKGVPVAELAKKHGVSAVYIYTL